MPFTSEFASETVESIADRGFALIPAHMTIADHAAWPAFAATWQDLTLDTYMADGGRYRYRRYGRFELATDTGELAQMPHAPYRQETDDNPLNGGIDRHFDPLTQAFVESPVLTSLLRELGDSYSRLAGHGRWEIMLHQNRIIASNGAAGHPSPEGPHRDGVDYIHTLLVDRVNVCGGESRVHDAEGEVLYAHTLETPGDMLAGDDRRTWHSVTPLAPVDVSAPGHRDVLVIGYTKRQA